MAEGTSGRCRIDETIIAYSYCKSRIIINGLFAEG